MPCDFDTAWAAMRRGSRYEARGDIGLFRLPAFCALEGLDHGLTARTGGVSEGGCASLNLSFTRESDPRENVMENYRIFARSAGIPWESMVMDTFEHGVTVRRADASHAGMGYLRPSLPPCDGLVTNDPRITLVTGHADCLPLYFYDPERRCVGLAHAGWKGVYGGIARKVVEALQAHYGSDPRALYAGVGPCICQAHFEVDEALGARFAAAFPGVPCVRPGRLGHAHVDLSMAAASQFLAAGIPPERIALSNVCTYCNAERLYSHRRDHGDTGGMAAFLRLLPARQA